MLPYNGIPVNKKARPAPASPELKSVNPVSDNKNETAMQAHPAKNNITFNFLKTIILGSINYFTGGRVNVINFWL